MLEFFIKTCSDCGIEISFENFCQMNPSIKRTRAKYLYQHPLISIYCSNCYFERPEKPFKKRRRDLNYYCYRRAQNHKLH